MSQLTQLNMLMKGLDQMQLPLLQECHESKVLAAILPSASASIFCSDWRCQQVLLCLPF